MKAKTAAFFKKEPVLIISFICAAVSMAFVPPSREYGAYFNWKVISLLFCLMAVVAGFKKCGLFEVLAQKLLEGRKNMRILSLVLVMLTFFTSMLITNDVALITFVPFTILVLGKVGRRKYLIFIIVLQTIAANLGSMATPVGNPQNLFLFSYYDMATGQFFAAMLPLVLVSLVCVAASALFVKGEVLNVRFEGMAKTEKPVNIAVFCVLFVAALLAVLNIVPHLWVLAATVLALLVFDRGVFKQVDYCLLFTFVCFFVFAGNIGRIEAVKAFLSGLLEQNAMLGSIITSQVISNVPAAVLLSGFTQDAEGMLLGTNIGGLGTLVASLASLISFKFYSKEADAKPAKYLGIFTLMNVIGLAVLIAAVYIL